VQGDSLTTTKKQSDGRATGTEFAIQHQIADPVIHQSGRNPVSLIDNIHESALLHDFNTTIRGLFEEYLANLFEDLRTKDNGLSEKGIGLYTLSKVITCIVLIILL